MHITGNFISMWKLW